MLTIEAAVLSATALYPANGIDNKFTAMVLRENTLAYHVPTLLAIQSVSISPSERAAIITWRGSLMLNPSFGFVLALSDLSMMSLTSFGEPAFAPSRGGLPETYASIVSAVYPFSTSFSMIGVTTSMYFCIAFVCPSSLTPVAISIAFGSAPALAMPTACCCFSVSSCNAFLSTSVPIATPSLS